MTEKLLSFRKTFAIDAVTNSCIIFTSRINLRDVCIVNLHVSNMGKLYLES